MSINAVDAEWQAWIASRPTIRRYQRDPGGTLPESPPVAPAGYMETCTCPECARFRAARVAWEARPAPTTAPEELCSNCEQPDDNCSCDSCSNCGDRGDADSTCGNCSQCDECCECESCDRCGGQFSETCSDDHCQSCCDHSAPWD